MSPVGKCKMCGKEDKLVKSHIVPRSLTRHIDASGGGPKVYEVGKFNRPRRAPIGIYDAILCDGCEARFSSWDNHAAKTIRFGAEHEVAIKDPRTGKPRAFLLEQGCDGKLQMFAVSMLWRASVSNRTEFATFKLGPHQDAIRKILHKNVIDAAFQYTTVIFKFVDLSTGKQRNDDIAAANLVSPPVTGRIDCVNFVTITIPGYGLVIKVDKRPAPFPLGDPGVCLCRGHPAIAIAQSYRDTSNYHAIRIAMRQAAGQS